MIKRLAILYFNYLRLFWSIAWRTFALSIATAILSGIGLGVMMVVKNWPPEFIEAYAPLIGTPITLIVGAYIVWSQTLRFAKQAQPA